VIIAEAVEKTLQMIRSKEAETKIAQELEEKRIADEVALSKQAKEKDEKANFALTFSS
jgi:hypothetical protein